MSERVAVIGDTGEGKSTAVRHLDPSQTAIINIMGKPLPFRGWKKDYQTIDPENKTGNYYVTQKSDQIVGMMKHISEEREDIKVIVIDDFQYLMSTEFMNRATEKGWDKFNEIGQHAWNVVYQAGNLREDLKVIFLAHDDTVEEDYKIKRKIKTIGKMLDDKVTLEGLFTVVLFSKVLTPDDEEEPKFRFLTKPDGTAPAKSPMGMFEEKLIPNNLKLVVDKIEAYYRGEEGDINKSQ